MLESERNRNPRSTHTLYSVEPSLKEGPGSLRDLHFARWIFKLLLGVEDGTMDRALKDHSGIPERQIVEVREAAQWFWRARMWMHLTAGKCSDVLITNYQDRIAQQLDNCSAQEWLSRHLAHSETLARFRETAVRTLLHGPINANGVLLEDGSLHRMKDAKVSETGMFHVSQRYSIPVSLDDRKRMEEGRERRELAAAGYYEKSEAKRS